jgi:hypothetical protein
MSKNDITGDEIKSKRPSKNYDENYDRIFKKGLFEEVIGTPQKLSQSELKRIKTETENQDCI